MSSIQSAEDAALLLCQQHPEPEHNAGADGPPLNLTAGEEPDGSDAGDEAGVQLPSRSSVRSMRVRPTPKAGANAATTVGAAYAAAAVNLDKMLLHNARSHKTGRSSMQRSTQWSTPSGATEPGAWSTYHLGRRCRTPRFSASVSMGQTAPSAGTSGAMSPGATRRRTLSTTKRYGRLRRVTLRSAQCSRHA